MSSMVLGLFVKILLIEFPVAEFAYDAIRDSLLWFGQKFEEWITEAQLGLSRKRWDTHTTAIDPKTRHRGFTLTTNFTRLLHHHNDNDLKGGESAAPLQCYQARCFNKSMQHWLTEIPLKCSHYLEWLQRVSIDLCIPSWQLCCVERERERLSVLTSC